MFQSREAELAHIEKWAAANNLKVNSSKSLEIVFVEGRLRCTGCLSPSLTYIQRVTILS